MKKSLLLYLLIISALMNLFIYMYFSQREKNAPIKERSSAARDSIKENLDIAMARLADADYFSLAQNQNAQNYFASTNLSIEGSYEGFADQIAHSLMEYNQTKDGNPYTGQSTLGSRPFIINKVRVLNYRWIIADYSDGEYWGEVLLKYFPNRDKSVEFEVIQTFIYSN
jgi:hypothetical protein